MQDVDRYIIYYQFVSERKSISKILFKENKAVTVLNKLS